MILTIFMALFSMVTTTAMAADDTWTDRVSIGGDFRFRQEFIDKEDQAGSNHRQRIRARLKTQGQVNEELKVILQVATGNLEATSTNQTLDGNYNNKGFELDMAYLQWAPSESWNVLAGKVKNTFFAPGDSELLLDSDVTPEGIAANWNRKNETRETFVNLASYSFEERDGEGATGASDTMQYSVQLGQKCTGSSGDFVFGLGHHVFSPIKGHAVLGAAEGNTLDGSNQYANDYATSEVFLTWGNSAMNFYGQYLSNEGADEENTAYLAGITLGKLKESGDWSLDYNYRETEADAVLGFLSDGDFADGEADSKGSRIKISRQLGKSTSAALTYILSTRDESGTPVDYERGQLDVVAKF